MNKLERERRDRMFKYFGDICGVVEKEKNGIITRKYSKAETIRAFKRAEIIRGGGDDILYDEGLVQNIEFGIQTLQDAYKYKVAENV